MKTENETVPNQSTEKTSSTSTTEWIRENTTPTIDILSETSSSPRISSSNLDGVVADCVVCGDKSSGKHYGQFSCEGCKSFFKRSIRRSLSYACRGTKNCPVDVNHRNQCQFCRLKKCVKMGMRRESVQQGRVHNVSPFLNCFLPSPFITTPRPSFPFVHPFIFNFTSSRNAFPQFIDSDDVRSSTNTIASASGACLSSRDIATNYLYSTIEWVRQLSFFNILTQHDQITLLQHNWAQLFILYVSGNSLPLQFNDESNAKDGNTYTEIIERIRSIHMDPFELNSIKAMVLFNPDTPSLQETLKIETLQEKVQTSLDEYCRSQKPHQLGRFGRILLRLPSLRTVNASTIETLFFSTFDVPIQMILNDLLNHSYMISKFWPYPMLPQFRIPSLS